MTLGHAMVRLVVLAPVLTGGLIAASLAPSPRVFTVGGAGRLGKPSQGMDGAIGPGTQICIRHATYVS